MINIHTCGNRFDELIQFATRLNGDGEHHIGFFGEGEADIRASLAECVIPLEQCFKMAYDGDELAGVFGVDLNPSIHRAWLFGPLVDHADWHTIADSLYEQVLPLIPTDIQHYDLYFDERNVRLSEFAERHGFSMLSQTVLMSLARQNYRPSARNTTHIVRFEQGFFDAFETLHNTVFPNTYFTARQIVEKMNESRQLLLAVDGARLLGYIFCKFEDVGYIDFIGTDEWIRGRGIGADLLACGVDWILSTPTAQRINLTVQANNTIARNLYTKFGFVAERVMTGYRKQVIQAGQ